MGGMMPNILVYALYNYERIDIEHTKDTDDTNNYTNNELGATMSLLYLNG
jgi:hypothetical protein